MEKIIPLDRELSPEAAVSGAVVLATEFETMLCFNAMRRQSDGMYRGIGLAVVRFDLCVQSKFGYPNDEAHFSIPRTRGLGYGCFEVLDSPWNEEICALNRHAFPDTVPCKSRHFLFLFHDSSFECLARGCTIEIVPVDRFHQIAIEHLRG